MSSRTRAQLERELLGLDLGDLVGVHLHRQVLVDPVGDGLVGDDGRLSPGVFDLVDHAAFLDQGLLVVTTSRLGLSLLQEGLRRNNTRSERRERLNI